MKIVYVIHSCFNSGGMERIVSLKANYLINKGFDVSIVVLNGLDRAPFFFFDPRISFYDLKIESNHLKFKQEFIIRLSDCLSKIQPDITISTGYGLVDYVYKSTDRSIKMLEIHFSKYKRKFELAALDKFLLGRLFTDLYSFRKTNIARKYTRFIVLTNEDKTYWRHLNNIEVIPNFVTIKPNNYSNNQQKQIIAVGRHTYQKGFDLLIDIWYKIQQKYPDWTLSIFGNGRKTNKLKAKVARLKLESSINFIPPSKDIEKEFAQTSIMVMTSRYEGLPLVLLEAMACGLPPVAYSCKCGPRDIIDDGIDGFLVKQGDEAKFIEKLSLLIDNAELRFAMGRNAISKASEFDEDSIMSRWINLFNELIEKPDNH